MTENELRRVIGVIEQADGGCFHCVTVLLDLLAERVEHPGFWDVVESATEGRHSRPTPEEEQS